MKNKKLLAIILSIVLVVLGGVGTVLIVNAINAFKPLSGGPSSNDVVIGNGGSSVQKGEYLYYASGFVDKNQIKYKQNDYNNVKGYGAIYRVKLVEDNYLLMPQYEDDDNYLIKNSQVVIPKIAAFDRASLYIFDNYLFYTSPHDQKDKYGNMQPSRIDFFRADLNGKNHKKIYTTSGDVDPENWTFVKATNGVVSLIIAEGQNLRAIQACDRNSSFSKVTNISTKADSFALPFIASYDPANILTLYSGMMGQVFYTEAPEKSSVGGNVFMDYNIATKKSSVINRFNGAMDGLSYKAMKLSNHTLLFGHMGLGMKEYNCYISKDVNAVTENKDQVVAGGIQGEYWLPTVQLSGNEAPYSENYVITLLEKKIWREWQDNKIPMLDLISEDIPVDQILTIRSTQIYFVSGDTIYVTDCGVKNPEVRKVFEMVDRNSQIAVDVNQRFFVYSKIFKNDDGEEFICSVMVDVQNENNICTLCRVDEEYRPKP